MPIQTLDQILSPLRYNLAQIGELLSEPSRVSILLALMDGSARPATELAQIANITPQTASGHFSLLIKGGLLKCEQHGRHRYYQIASHEVANALEAIALLRIAPVHKIKANQTMTQEKKALCLARSCYKHLAGKLGVLLIQKLRDNKFTQENDRQIKLTKEGLSCFVQLGFSKEILTYQTGKLCLDWTERQYHIGGSLGAIFLELFLEHKWLAKINNSRALRITQKGEECLKTLYIHWPP